MGKGFGKTFLKGKTESAVFKRTQLRIFFFPELEASLRVEVKQNAALLGLPWEEISFPYQSGHSQHSYSSLVPASCEYLPYGQADQLSSEDRLVAELPAEESVAQLPAEDRAVGQLAPGQISTAQPPVEDTQAARAKSVLAQVVMNFETKAVDKSNTLILYLHLGQDKTKPDLSSLPSRRTTISPGASPTNTGNTQVDSILNIYLLTAEPHRNKYSLNFLASIGLPSQNARFLLLLDHLSYRRKGRIIQVWGEHARVGASTFAWALAGAYSQSCYVNASGKLSCISAVQKTLRTATGLNELEGDSDYLTVEKVPAPAEDYLATYLVGRLPVLKRRQSAIAYLDYGSAPSEDLLPTLMHLSGTLARLYPVVVVDCGEIKRMQPRAVVLEKVEATWPITAAFKVRTQPSGVLSEGISEGFSSEILVQNMLVSSGKRAELSSLNLEDISQSWGRKTKINEVAYLRIPYSWQVKRMQEIGIDWPGRSGVLPRKILRLLRKSQKILDRSASF